MSLLDQGSDGGQTGGDQSQGSGNPGTQGAQGGTQTPPAASGRWQDALPEEIKSNTAIQQFTDVGALAKSYIHAQSMIGKKGVVVPSEKSAPEEWDSFYKAIGRPELDKYELQTKEGFNEDLVKAFKETSHKAGILPKQAQAQLEWFAQYEQSKVEAAMKASQEEAKTQVEALKKEWGEGFTKNIQIAKAARDAVGEEFAAYLEKSGLGNDVNVIKALAHLGKFLGEDKLRGVSDGKLGSTPAEVAAEHEEMQAKMYAMSPNDPQYATIRSKVEMLARKRYGA